MFFIQGKENLAYQLINDCQAVVLSGVDYKQTDELPSLIKEKTQTVINTKLIPETINHEMKASDEDTKERLRYTLTSQINQHIKALAPFYIPTSKVEFSAYERLLVPAFIGAILFGIIFYYALGSFFKEPLYASIIGMPFGAAFFVYLFSKAIRHPFMTKMIKWASVAGMAFIAIGAVFTTLKTKLILKPKISLIQWVWLALLTILTFWVLHLFKPRKVVDEAETKRLLEGQVQLILSNVYTFSHWMIEHASGMLTLNDSDKMPLQAEEPIYMQSKQWVSSIQQMKYAHHREDPKAALLSISSFLNSLQAMGIHEKEQDVPFQYTCSDADYFHTFGIIQEGDWVEPIYNAWVDDDEKCVFKGKVRKVKP